MKLGEKVLGRRKGIGGERLRMGLVKAIYVFKFSNKKCLRNTRPSTYLKHNNLKPLPGCDRVVFRVADNGVFKL